MIIELSCPAYKIGDDLDLNEVSKVIDGVLVDNFSSKKVVLRAISSSDHQRSKEELARLIEQTGSDRYDPTRAGDRYKNIENKQIDLFGQTKVISKESSLSLSLLKGFHIYGAEFHGRPSPKMDVWLVYDRSKLKYVSHYYEKAGAMKRDGYIFKDQDNKPQSLLGVIVIT